MMNRERLMRGLDALGIAYDQTAMERFEAFHAILDEYNQRMDLTAVLDEDERVDRHDLDSAAPLAQESLAATRVCLLARQSADEGTRISVT